MPQEPLTSAGVINKQTSLYALSNSALLVEANSIRSDFRSWLLANFIFNADQTSYLNGIDQKWIDFVASETGFCVENRLGIALVAPDPLPPPSISKMVTTENTIVPHFSPSGGFTVSGTLTFNLIY